MNRAKIRLVPYGSNFWRAQGPGHCFTIRSTPERAFGAYILYYYGGSLEQYQEDLRAGEWFVTRLPLAEASHLAMKINLHLSPVGKRAYLLAPAYQVSKSPMVRSQEDVEEWVSQQWPSHPQSEAERRSYRSSP